MNFNFISLIKNIFKKIIFRVLINFFPKANIVSDKSLHIVSLLCHKHVYMYIYALHSFFYFIDSVYPIIIINDGTLTKTDISLLKKHFTVTIITRKYIETKLRPAFKRYLHLKHYVLSDYSEIIKWKIAYMALNPFPRYIFIDSDVLFFSKPEEIIKWIKTHPKYCLNMEYNDRSRINKGNAADNYLDIYHAYGECLKKTLFPNINTLYNIGIHCISDGKLINCDKLNHILGIFHETYFDNQFPSDELALSCLLTNKHSRSLPKEKYTIQLLGGRPPLLPQVCKHYCWDSKQLYILDAINVAIRSHLFRK